jgi:hypothetical protein
MADVSIRKGDRLPQLERQFLVDAAGVDLSGATVVFNMYKATDGTQVITNGSVTVVTASTGLVRYAWTAADAALDADTYLASFTATYGDGRKLTAPNTGMLVVEFFDLIEVDWLYTGEPGTRTIDAVRLLIGDTDSTDQLITDNEISYLLTRHGSINRTASEACRAIAAKFARLMNRSIGGLSADFSQKYHQYMELADSLLTKEETEPVSPFTSGWKRSVKEAREADTERETTFGRKGIHDNERVYPADDYSHAPYRLR